MPSIKHQPTRTKTKPGPRTQWLDQGDHFRQWTHWTGKTEENGPERTHSRHGVLLLRTSSPRTPDRFRDTTDCVMTTKKSEDLLQNIIIPIIWVTVTERCPKLLRMPDHILLMRTSSLETLDRFKDSIDRVSGTKTSQDGSRVSSLKTPDRFKDTTDRVMEMQDLLQNTIIPINWVSVTERCPKLLQMADQALRMEKTVHRGLILQKECHRGWLPRDFSILLRIPHRALRTETGDHGGLAA